ncbi:MAG: serine protease, partial [Planctomycetes bacterium]|nr:serine protease [Planctomycetota bacterium]
PHSTIGDCQPIVPTQEGFKEAGEKVESPLRAQFRKFAKKNNYPELLLAAMVTRNLDIYRLMTDSGQRFVTARELEEMTEREKDEIRSKTLVTRVAGELLTLDQQQAVEFGVAKHVAQDLSEVLKLYGVKSAEAPKLETNWSEEMVRFLDSIAPILLAIGMIAIWMELKAPGFGVFGVIAVACFATVFLAKYLVGLAEAPEILLFVVGIAFIAAEIFLLPGTAVLGLLGVVIMLIGLVLSFQDFVLPAVPYETDVLWSNVFKIGCSFVAAIIGFVLIARFLPGVPVVNRIILMAAENAELGFTVEKPEEKRLVGKSGMALSTLRPSGRAEIDGQPVDVVAEGDFIPAGQPIVVAEVKGTRIVVRPA